MWDRISGVMASVLASSVVDRGFIGDVMASVLPSSVVDRWFQLRSGQTKDYKISICCLSAKHAELRRKNKDWLAQNQDNVPEWVNMSIRGLLFQWAGTIKIQLRLLFNSLVESRPPHNHIEN